MKGWTDWLDWTMMMEMAYILLVCKQGPGGERGKRSLEQSQRPGQGHFAKGIEIITI